MRSYIISIGEKRGRMSELLTKEQVEDLLLNVLGSPKIMPWKGDKIQFCCTVHGESNPSAGINIDFHPEDEPGVTYQTFNCFACGEHGSIPWLVYKSLPDRFHSMKQAADFLEKRYGVKYSEKHIKISGLKRYDEKYSVEETKRFEMPKVEIAPFKSGRETYKYFFDRGFDKSDMREFLIGRDLKNETVTIPVFYEDGVLAGVIGRYVDKHRAKNERYKIYNFPKSSVVFPLDKLKVVDDTIIGVEGMFDVMMLHKWGFPNAVAIMGNRMSTAQAGIISDKCKKFIDLFDNDEGGKKAREIAKKKLKGKVLYLTPTYYPERGKDPSEWGEIETLKVLNSVSIGRKIQRL